MRTRSSPFVALQHRNFRLLWSSQLVSFSGSMMQSAAILWHVSLLVPPERKGIALGLVGLVRVLPVIGFSLVGGVVADALDRRRLMIFTQAAMALAAATLAFLAFNGLAAVWPIYVLAALGSAAGSFDSPARQSLIPSLVPEEHFPNAISLNSIMFQLASVLGPTMAGVVIADFGIAWAYTLNALSFLVVIGALLAMRGVRERRGDVRPEISRRSAREGLDFVFRSPIIRSMMLLDFFATFFASATALLPIFAQDILRVGAHGYGILYAAPSVGAVVASLVMVQAVGRMRYRGRVLLVAVFAYGLATVAFGLSRVFWLSFAFLALGGAADTVSTVLRNIIRQLATPDSLRGRMTSINMMFFMGGPQLGEMEAGLVANWLGAPFSVVSGGIACVLTTAWVGLRTPALRRYTAASVMQAEEVSPVDRRAAR